MKKTTPINPQPPIPRRVLLVGTFLSESLANANVCEELAERLEEVGWDVHTTSHHLARLPRLWDMVRTTWQKRHAYDVAHVDVFSGRAFIWAEAVCATLRQARRPYVLTLHGGNLPVFARRWPRRVQHLLGTASAVTAPSRYLYEQMKPYREDVLLLPNPLDLSRFTFRERTTFRPHLVWVRAFHQMYNPALAPHVVAQLVDDWPDMHLFMVGPDKGDGSLGATRRIVQALGIQDHVTFVGGVPRAEVPAWLQRGDIFLNTTNVDNTPVSVLEAMACGLAVVSTDVGGLPYLLKHQQDALLVPPDDAEAMGKAVTRLLKNPDLAQRLSQQARVAVSAMSWEVLLPRWEQVLSQIAPDA